MEKLDNSPSNLNQDSLDPQNFVLPTYALKANETMRQNLFREAGAIKPGVVKLFEEMCRYASSPECNSGLIDVDDFYVQLDIKAKAELGDLKKVFVLLTQMAEKFDEDQLGVMSVLHQDAEGNIKTVALLDRSDELESLYRKVERLLLQNLQEVRAKKTQFKSYAELKKEFHLYKNELNSLIVEQSAKTISHDTIRDFAQKDKLLVVIKLEHDVGDIVVPAKKLGHLVNLFIELIYSYYQDPVNESLRKLIRKRINKQRVEVDVIVQAFREAQMKSPHFLFFSQLFYTIMNKLSEKFYTQSYISSEVVNQLIASRFLMLFSFNLREKVRDGQISEEKNQSLFEAIVDSLVTKYIAKSGKNVYFPATMGDFLKISIQTKEKSGENVEIFAKDKLNVGDIEEYIAQLDSDKHTIPDVVTFEVEGKVHYVHRVRLMQSFLSLVDVERILVENKILMMWVNDPKKIPSKKNADFFYNKIDEEYSSPLFIAFFLKIVEIFSMPSPISKKAFDASYFLSRLFFDEAGGLRFESRVNDLIFLAKDINRKKKILKAFFSTIFDETYRPQSLHSILGIDFFALRKKALNEAGIGFFSHFFSFFFGLFSQFVPFVGDKKKYIKNISDSLDFKKKKSPKDVAAAGDKNGGIFAKKSTKKSTDSKSPTKETTKQASQKAMLKDFPILKNTMELSRHLDDLSSKWNYKMGETRADFQETIDDRISEFARRFDANAFTKESQPSVVDRFLSSNHKIVNEIIDKKSFREYVFYKAAFYKMK